MPNFTTESIRSYLEKIKNLLIRDGLISSIKNCPSTYYKKGVGIAAIASATVYMMNMAIHEMKYNTEDNESLKQKGKQIYNLEELVERRARKLYQQETKRFLFLGNPNFKVDWDDVEFVPGEIKYRRLLYKEMENEDLLNVLFKTVLKNDSKLVQQHTLRAKRKTVYGCESFLTEGYTKGSKVGMSIPLPNVILESGIGISKSVTINYTKGNSEEKQVEWDVEDSIQVPGKSTITIEIRTNEKQSEFEFKTRVGFKGHVGGIFYNKNQKIMRTFTIPISSIINELPDDMIVTEDNIMYIKIKGRIKYRYDIEHDIVINNPKHSVCAIL